MATVTLDLSNLAELCRICGSRTTPLSGLHIFEREGIVRELFKKIKACLPIHVSKGDKLPKTICEECAYKVDAIFDFRERSLKTEYDLHEMLKSSFAGCTETLTIPIQSFCDDTVHQDLEVPQREVVIGLDNDGPLITLPISTHNNVKCESKIDVSDLSSQEVISSEKYQDDSSKRSSVSCLTEERESCPATSQGISQTVRIQDVSNLQNVSERVDKEIEISSTEGYILSGPVPPEELRGQQPSEAESWYFCHLCGKPFRTSEEFHAHCENHWHKCSECEVSCATQDLLVAHMSDAHPYRQETSAPRQTDLGENSVDKPQVDGKQCPECGKVYKTKYKLSEHMRRHTGERPFKCSMCEKSFRSKIGCAQHEAKHTGRFDYNCVTCGKGFQCKSYLIVHQRVHSDVKPYPCETCGRNFKTKQSLLDHQNRHLGVKPYICEVCGRGFITKGLCKSHLKVHLGLDNRQYPCSVCNKLFVSKSYLATHHRIHTGDKPFKCEVCGKGFLTRVDLRIHSTIHTGEKSFVCEVCGKAFARRDALRCHKRSHTGERPYKCDICGQGFTQFSPMAIHKRLHTGERPYSCDICLKAFVSRSTMMSHRKKHNPS